jgi:NADH-quinone oxidoreductase subunit L
MGGPGRAGFEAVAEIDATVVDGAVNGTGGLVQAIGSKVRVVQTGYVRNYALGIAGGAVLALGWFLVRAGF